MAVKAVKKSGAQASGDDDAAARLIDGRINELGDWRGETLARVRALSWALAGTDQRAEIQISRMVWWPVMGA